MTFKDIQKNHPVYILDKSNVEVSQGKVINAVPHVNMNLGTVASGTQPMRDVTVEVNGKQIVYTIPEQLSVTFAGNLVLATEQSGLLPEVSKLVNEADEVIKSYESSKERKAKGEELLSQLDPSIKEKQDIEKRFVAIEGALGGIKGMVGQLLDKLG